MKLEKLLAEKIDRGLKDIESAKARQETFYRRLPGVREAVQKFPTVGPNLRKVKEDAISRLAELTDEAEKNLRNKGFQVLRARSAEQAVEYINSLIPDGSLVVKSKSNAVKETGLLDVLAERGVEVVETDLGDRICQVGDIPAAHPLGPAIHVPVAKVAEIFSRQLGKRLEPKHEEIVAAVRESLRNNLLEADIGISGANAIAADTGSVVLMENEGNIRAVTNYPPVHIVVAGVEKIVPTLEDGLKVVKASALYGTTQDVSSYVSVISGPSRYYTANSQQLTGMLGPKSVHVILLETGRFEAATGELKESLYCINCGHCLRACPVFAELGEQYGYKFFGGIGLIHAAVRYGFEKAVEGGLSLCLGCGRCMEVCPSNIPTPEMIKTLRISALRKNGLPWRKKFVLRRLLPNRMWLKAAEPLQGVFFRSVPERNGIRSRFYALSDKNRLLPRLPSRQIFNVLPERIPAKGQRKARVGYFPGCMGTSLYTQVAEATVQVLTRNGIEMFLPSGQVCCGMPMTASGDTQTAKAMAIANLQAFGKTDLATIIVDCPSCGVGLRQYGEILREESSWQAQAADFSAKIQDVCDFLDEIGLEKPKGTLKTEVAYHKPCHLRETTAPENLLRQIPGLSVLANDGEDRCCGFGGTFSLEFYRLSKVIADRRIEHLPGQDVDVVTACPGCMLQLNDALYQNNRKAKAMHLTQLLAIAYGEEGGS